MNFKILLYVDKENRQLKSVFLKRFIYIAYIRAFTLYIDVVIYIEIKQFFGRSGIGSIPQDCKIRYFVV